MANGFRTATPLCIAHRGASRRAPENTLRAFDCALEAGADGIELDVQATRDGTAVVFHDATLARLTSMPGRIERTPWRRLRELRVAGEPIPTLAEALESIGDRAVVQIELKAAAVLPPVLRAIRQTGSSDRIILASFRHRIVREAAALAPRLLRMLIAGRPQTPGEPEAGALKILRTMASVGAHGVSIDHRAVTSERFVETVRRRAVRLWCWTVNDPRAMRRLAAWGVDGILTDDPGRMIDALGPRPAPGGVTRPAFRSRR